MFYPNIPEQLAAFFVSAITAFLVFYVILLLAVAALMIAAYWLVFKKAGEPGWAALIPFYRTYVLYKITWSSGWYFFLTWIPGFGMIFCYVTLARLCKRFHKGDGFTVGMLLVPLVFLCILAFGKSAFQPVQHPTEEPQPAPAETASTTAQAQREPECAACVAPSDSLLEALTPGDAAGEEGETPLTETQPEEPTRI